MKIRKNEEGKWVTEAIERKKVVRKGKVIKKKVSTKPGYRIDKDGREVRMTPEEIRKRERGAKKAAKKKKGKRSQTARAMKKSQKIRKSRLD